MTRQFWGYVGSLAVALLVFGAIFVLITLGLQNYIRYIEAAKTTAQILGGSLFVLTAYYSWQTAKAASENSETASKNLLIAQQKLELDSLTTAATLRIAEAKQASERFVKATENLDSETLPTRIGAIYSLEQVAYESEQNHRIVFELIGAYLSHRTKKKKPVDMTASELGRAVALGTPIGETADLRAAIHVIGRRRAEFDNGLRILATNCDLLFFRFANKDMGILKPCFDGVVFASSKLGGVYAADCLFRSTSFNGADLTAMNLSFSDCCGAQFRHAILSGANFTEANLTVCDFTRAKFGNANLKGANFLGADLTDADLSEVLNMTQSQVASLGNLSAMTRFPKGIEPPKPILLKPSPEHTSTNRDENSEPGESG